MPVYVVYGYTGDYYEPYGVIGATTSRDKALSILKDPASTVLVTDNFVEIWNDDVLSETYHFEEWSKWEGEP